jgi:tRNA A58 N-methylase Trm61
MIRRIGNGYDALFLAETVGETGYLFGFDVQEKAVEHARGRLLDAGVGDFPCSESRDSCSIIWLLAVGREYEV